jgi:tRNA U34 5-methylaminomethyl-2-thiouridine-forming methyltransferase MnmC
MTKLTKTTTHDNSETFINEDIGQSYHSFSGAVEEALKKYVIPCKIEQLAKEGEIKILDVCFGMGYNSAMAIDVALNTNSNCKIIVYGVENDPEIVKKIQEVNPKIDFFKHYKNLTPQNLEFKQNNVEVKLILEDLQTAVNKLPENYFDAIFYDPFSPSKQPELWTEELFKEMHRVIKKTGILATYSCARMVRDNLIKADFIYDDGPIVGRRGPGTVAKKLFSFISAP